MEQRALRHLDLFSGYGGFTIAAQKQGWQTINFSEIDKYATAVLKYRFPDIKNLGDITKIKPEDLPDVDIITGGSPCQDLSVAGKGAGLDGERSGLFFCFINLIAKKQPMYFIWENVKGALSSSKGWDFARVQIEMEQAGYDVFWQVINAKDFGVPQNRERIFAIGIRKGSGREVLFEQIGSSQNIKTRQQVSSTIHAGYYKQGGRDQQYVEGAKTELYAVALRNRGQGKQPEFNGTDKANSITSVQTDSMVAIDLSTQEPQITENIRTLQARYHKGYSKRKGEVSGVLDDMRIRRLTPTECERLMGLEDGWTAKGVIDGKEVDISDTQRYKMCGNGVVVNCVDYIYNLISKTL